MARKDRRKVDASNVNALLDDVDSRQNAATAAKNLRSWRKEAALSQEQAAVMARLTMITIQRLERGQAELRVDDLIALSRLYGRDWREAVAKTPSGTADFSSVPLLEVVFHPKAALDDDDKMLIRLRATDAAKTAIAQKKKQ